MHVSGTCSSQLWATTTLLLTRLWWPFPRKCSRLDTVWSICVRKKLVVLLTKVDPWAGWAMAHGKLQGHDGCWWLPYSSECCPGCRRNALGSAPAMSPGSLSALRPPFPQSRVELEVAGSCLMLEPWFSVLFQ